MSVAENDRRSYGRVEIEELGVETLSPATRPARKPQVSAFVYRWTPPADLQDDFHPDFSIAFCAYAGADGMRRFLPAAGVERFIDQAFAAGLALLEHEGRLTAEHASVYRAMKLIFDRVRSMREHLGREFNSSRDLFIRQRGRESDAERSVLPVHLGLNADGQGRNWTPKRLCAEGRTRARETGVERITNDVAIPYGLLAAAERNPLQISNNEAAALVRMALFAPSNEEETLDEACLERVFFNLTGLLNEHRFDSEEDYQRWCAGPNSNFFKAIARREMSVGMARKAVLQLGWQAYEYVSGCVSYFIQHFVHALPTPLSDRERELLEHMYQPQPYLGGLPLIFLLERHKIIAPLSGRLWESPGDPELIPVLHRLLQYYGEMAPARRRADVNSKRNRTQLETANSDLAKSLARASADDPMERILDRVVEQYDLCCDQCARRS